MTDTEKKMKAYRVYDREFYEPYVMIVFAESRGKAISYALGTDEFPRYDFDYTQLAATRAKWADKYYKGKREMDWDNAEDRIAMVKDGGFICSEDGFDPDDCERCYAKDLCEKYEEYLEEEQEGEDDA